MPSSDEMELPGDREIRSEMESLMKTVNLNTMSTKEFISALSKKLGGVDLSTKKKFIKKTITEIIDAMQPPEEEDQSDDGVLLERDPPCLSFLSHLMPIVTSESLDEEPAKPSGGRGGLMAEKEISDDLMNLLGCKKRMARTDIVKRMWQYIRNPKDKREIILDSRMREVFKVDNFTMFRLTVTSMNKYIGAHIDPYKPVDLTTNSSASSKRKAKSTGGEPGKKKKRAPGVQAPWRLSEAMVAVVGKPVLPRPQITQALWAYIRENNLQFSMNKYVTPHLLEKLNKSEYDPSDFLIDVPPADADSPSESETSAAVPHLAVDTVQSSAELQTPKTDTESKALLAVHRA
ncbi:hypothetical protein THAOC_24008 [Thalassiosira oceanica]|uniref:DEK-C domain-containing protein n=1 Tax=Thalassiosira oceanica TaxID=159749 RepID=K0RQX7_THAOC|nr:hypothetical protein THAOC_24008 [Thalassiosira oceanica]|eukprot:EJK56158.1 hypothetical protein THAOC_24008 [Thalassiosira oceanica]